MTTPYAPVAVSAGESGYFSAPTPMLDPHLFAAGTDKFLDSVRQWVLGTLYGYWEGKYRRPRDWSTVWVAGSGISHQWSASRGNGDLDILIGVDFPLFFRSNREYLGFGENDMASIFNQEFHAELWPSTSATSLPSSQPDGPPQTYEVTFYVNPGADDIRKINPYAAYSLTDDSWTVRPPTVEQSEHRDVPAEYWSAVADERRLADTIVTRYNAMARQTVGVKMDTPGWRNAVNSLNLVAAQAKSLFDDIHLGRRQAFGPGGSGYGDYYNFRWQAHKQAGTVQALDEIAKSRDKILEQAAVDSYGAPIESADVVLRRAALWNRGRR